MATSIVIPVKLSAQVFRRYCAFDTFRRQRRWFAPIMTGMVLVTVSMALLTLTPGQSEGLAGVLMGLGAAIPIGAFALYFVQIESQVAKLHLKENPSVYTLTLRAEGVRVQNDQKDENPVEIAWEALWAAFRHKGCVYLYANPQRAFLLPDGQGSASSDEVWNFIERHMGAQRCKSM